MAAAAPQQVGLGTAVEAMDPNNVSDGEEKSVHAENDTGKEVEIKPSPPAHSFPELSTTRQVLLVCFMTLAMVLNIMQTQSTVLALTTIGADLNIRISNYQWLSSSYSLAFGSLLLLFGRLADIYGHKRVFLLGVAWFLVWSIACGFAPNEISIDVFRAMQGCGAGAFIPSALGILGSSFPPSQAKSTAFATFSAGAPIGGSLGAVMGGILTEYAPAGWRAIFYVTSGIAAIIFIGALLVVPPDAARRPENKTVDWIGSFMIVSGLVLTTFALADGEGAPKGWRTPYIPVLFTLGICLLIGFWFWEKHVEFNTDRVPIMRTTIWHRPKFAIVQLVGGLGWCCFSSVMFFITIYYQDYLKLSPVLATVRFLPSPATGIILNVIVAFIVSRVPANFLMALGGLGTGLAPLLFAVQDVHASFWQYNFPGAVLLVFGADFIFSCGIMYVSKVAGPGEQGLAGGIFNSTTQIGTAFGLSIMTIIQTRVTAAETRRLGGVYNPDSKDIPPEALLKGLRAAFYGCAAFAFTSCLISITCLWGIGLVGHRAPKPIPAADKAEKGDA